MDEEQQKSLKRSNEALVAKVQELNQEIMTLRFSNDHKDREIKELKAERDEK